jgi:hypothetical protein
MIRGDGPSSGRGGDVRMTAPGQQPRRATRERTIQPGPRCVFMVWWVLIDVALAVGAVMWGIINLDRHRALLAYTLFGAAATLVVLDIWRLVFLNQVRHLVSHGRIEQADIVAVKRARMSLRPRADAPSPTGGWPIVPAYKVSYLFRRSDGGPVRGAFMVATKEAEMFAPGEDIEVFVDRNDSSKVIPSLVARWYFRVSSRMIGTGADDLEWDFTNPPPASKEKPPARYG